MTREGRSTKIPFRWVLLLTAILLVAPVRAGAQDGASPDLTVDYRIGPADKISILVWRNEELSVLVPVLPNGKISVPLIGSIPAAGKTTEELQKIVTEKLKEYITEPNVTVIVVEVNSFIIYVIGEVTRPGPQMIPQRTTVLQALSTAGGFTQFADKGDINILRRQKGKDMRLHFDYKAVAKGRKPESNIVLKPGDVIIVSD